MTKRDKVQLVCVLLKEGQRELREVTDTVMSRSRMEMQISDGVSAGDCPFMNAKRDNLLMNVMPC